MVRHLAINEVSTVTKKRDLSNYHELHQLLDVLHQECLRKSAICCVVLEKLVL